VGARIRTYKNYPRVVGETGGKDFIVAHKSAEVDALVTALVRGAFEFSGQKCSAASRAYLPRSLWNALRPKLVEATMALKMGDVADYRNFLGAVIHERAFDRLHGWANRCAADTSCTMHATREWSKATGWFAPPTVIEVADPQHPLLATELFGPVLGVFVYDDDREDEMLKLVDETSPYALTGALFARDRAFLAKAAARLRHAAGNLYINDKPTGAVVGQQPFGGARASGTNDKAGSPANLLRWVQLRTVKETFVAPTRVEYPFQREP
jgi:1-pyrroline-5-carboxylate dehydrogenase